MENKTVISKIAISDDKLRSSVMTIICNIIRLGKFMHNLNSLLIEMQKAEQQFFKDRSVFYSTFPIRTRQRRAIEVVR